MKIDPHRSKERYLRWKRERAHKLDLSKESLGVILEYLEDMEEGRNIAPGTRRGARSYIHVNTTKNRLVFLAQHLERCFGTLLTQVSEDQVHAFFRDMRSGEMRKRDGSAYRSTGDYVKVFKTFWYWHMRVQRKKGTEVPDDVCSELDDRRDKPPWVYVTLADVQRLCRAAKWEYRVLMMFLFDTGIRCPTELVNIRVRDLSQNCGLLTIREETSKTFGRTIKLLLCSDLLREHIRARDLTDQDQVFPISPTVVNRYLRRLAKRVLGDERTAAGQRYSQLTMYDFRHSSACYWLPRYKTESSLKFRFGWKRSEMIHYYTEFLGMRDTITEDDLLIDDEKTEVEKELAETRREKAILEDRLRAMDQQMQDILQRVTVLADRAT